MKEGAKVLVIGAGRIGCEVLKTLALSGCQDIHIIDKGFVEVSDLNGQFLFRQSHVGKSKASIARRAILELRPEISITSHHGNIKEPDFDACFFEQFNVVLIGIDNFDAIRHVNRLCLTSNVPLIDSWTVGFLGQVTVNVNGITECYECWPKAAAETYSVCTITSTPSEFVHCMVWAKEILFAKLFGYKSVTSDLTGDSSSEQAEDVFDRKNDEDVEQYGRRIYDHVFGHNIEVALSNGETWNNRCRPKPIYSRDALPNDISQHNRDVETNGATNDPLSEHAMASLGLQNSRAVLSLEENSRIFLEALKLLLMKKEKRFGNITFDKDDQLAVEFVTAAANIRASAFGIPPHSLFGAKGIVGYIVPAVATTNAIIAGLIAIETVKVLQNDKKNYRMTYCLERRRKKMLLIPVKPLEPNKFCYVCSKTPLSLEINTNCATLRDIVEKVVKNKLGMNSPLIRHGKDLLYVDGSFLDAAMIIKSVANLDKVLSEFLSPITSGTMMKIEDFQQGLSCNINIKHREDFDEEKEPDGMVLSALTQATSLVKDDEKFNANAGSTSNASELEADKNNEIEIALGMKRKRSEVTEANSDDSADAHSLSNEGVAVSLLHGTTVFVILVRRGVFFFVDSRSTISTHFSVVGTRRANRRIPVQQIVGDDESKFFVLAPGVCMAASGSASRVQNLYSYLIARVNMGITDIQVLMKAAHSYLTDNPCPSGSARVQAYIGGWSHTEKRSVVYVVGDGWTQTYEMNSRLYGGTGSGWCYAKASLEKENVQWDLDMNEDLVLPAGIRALCLSAEEDPDTGGMLRAFFVNAVGSEELWARHTIQALYEAPESTFPKSDIYILLPNEDDYDLSGMLSSQLLKYGRGRGSIRCLGNAGARHFLYHVRFSSEAAASLMFSHCIRVSEVVRMRRFEVHPERQSMIGYVGKASREFLMRAHSWV